jgi:hypothetical protein
MNIIYDDFVNHFTYPPYIVIASTKKNMKRDLFTILYIDNPDEMNRDHLLYINICRSNALNSDHLFAMLSQYRVIMNGSIWYKIKYQDLKKIIEVSNF